MSSLTSCKHCWLKIRDWNFFTHSNGLLYCLDGYLTTVICASKPFLEFWFYGRPFVRFLCLFFSNSSLVKVVSKCAIIFCKYSQSSFLFRCSVLWALILLFALGLSFTFFFRLSRTGLNKSLSYWCRTSSALIRLFGVVFQPLSAPSVSFGISRRCLDFGEVGSPSIYYKVFAVTYPTPAPME